VGLLNRSADFTQNPENYMLFPPIAFGPYASVNPDSIDVADVVRVRINPVPMIGTVNIRQDFSIARSASFGPFINKTDKEVRKLRLTDYFSIPETIRRAIGMRFKNESAAAVSAATKGIDGQEIIISLSTYSQRTRPSKTVGLTFTERVAKGAPGADQVYEINFNRELNRISPFSEKSGGDLWTTLSEDAKKEILRNVQSRFLGRSAGKSAF